MGSMGLVERKIMRVLGLGLGCALGACTPAFEGKYEDPDQVEVLDDKWNPSDAKMTAEAMIAAALGDGKAGPDHWLTRYKATHGGKKPMVFVDEVENRTDEVIDTAALTDFIRDELINSGQVRFSNREGRSKILDELKFQHGGAVDPATARQIGKQIGADYMLGGAMSSSVHTQGGEKSVTYQVALNLTNLETAELEWSSKKLIKKKFKRAGAGW